MTSLDPETNNTRRLQVAKQAKVAPEPGKTPEAEGTEEDAPIPDHKGSPEEPEGSSGAAKEDPQAQLVELVQQRGKNPTDEVLQDIVDQGVGKVVAPHDVTDRYNVLVLFDTGRLVRGDADRIYTALGRCEQTKPILFVLHSNGGDVSAAYFIGKLCRERTPDRFLVAVPRRAKSAATLICCGADEIHMGSLSELGPIDPQFEGVPALALKYSIEHLADLTKRYPDAAEMFSNYLAKALNIQELGYYERVAESAVQYAERLMKSRVRQGPVSGAEIAHRLVYSYKDHGFVIDSHEALEIFGPDVVKQDTAEYRLANDLYTWLDLYQYVVRDLFNRQMYFVGDATKGSQFYAL